MDMVERASTEIKRAKTLVEQAKKRIPAEFHDFVAELEHSVKLGPKVQLNDEMRRLGMWATDGGTYVAVRVPYMTVDGRVAMMVEQHRKAGQGYTLTVEPELIGEDLYMKATFSGLSAGGVPCTTVGRARIMFGGRSVDATNPVENAETSAVGRALAFAGYGLIGTGIASAQEVATAQANGSNGKKITPEQKRALNFYVASLGLDPQNEKVQKAMCEAMEWHLPIDDLPHDRAVAILKNPKAFAAKVKEKLAAGETG